MGRDDDMGASGLGLGAPLTPAMRLGLALREQRPSMALAMFDAVGSAWSNELQQVVRATIWFQAGSVRGLRESGVAVVSMVDGEAINAEGPVEAGLAEEIRLVAPSAAMVETILARAAFDEVDIPRASPEVLVLMRDAAANAGRAAELARVQLALAEHAERVDQRVGLVEAAESLANILDDRCLGALVQAFLARVDADFGEDDDAAERVAVVLRDVSEAEAPRAVGLALAVKGLLALRKNDEFQAAACRDKAVRLFAAVGWGEGIEAYPGPVWGLVGD